AGRALRPLAGPAVGRFLRAAGHRGRPQPPGFADHERVSGAPDADADDSVADADDPDRDDPDPDPADADDSLADRHDPDDDHADDDGAYPDGHGHRDEHRHRRHAAGSVERRRYPAVMATPTEIGGRYRLDRRLGAGGMST